MNQTLQALSCCIALATFPSMADSLAVSPAEPTPLDTATLVYAHVGCTDPHSMQVAQRANAITVQVDRIFFPDCGTVQGYSEAFSMGRLPAGDYDAQLVVNPPRGTLGPSIVAGTVHFTVAALPTGGAHPHDNYADMWWNPAQPGWALTVQQSGEKLFLVWNVYDALGQPTWFVLPAGAWSRDASNVLRYSGTIYRTSGPAWDANFDGRARGVAAVGSAQFTPLAADRATLAYTINGESVTQPVQRFRF